MMAMREIPYSASHPYAAGKVTNEEQAPKNNSLPGELATRDYEARDRITKPETVASVYHFPKNTIHL